MSGTVTRGLRFEFHPRRTFRPVAAKPAGQLHRTKSPSPSCPARRGWSASVHERVRQSRPELALDWPSWLFFAAIIMVAAIVVLTGSVAFVLAGVRFPTLTEITSPRLIVLTSADGHVLPHAGESRLVPVAAKDMPPNLVNAVLSIEDRRFYRHGALDFRSMLRAFGQNMEAGRIVAGGSTITQQLVKTDLLDPERTYRRKIREAVISIWLEHLLTKDQILTAYLNSVYLGSGARGFPAAAQLYFGRTPSQLNLAEAAMLAGMINAPAQNNPLHDVDAARQRAATVLDAMVANGKLTQAEALVAKLHPATASRANLAPTADGWFGDWVYDKAVSATAPDAGAVRIRTTLDTELQQKASEIVNADPRPIRRGQARR